MKKFNESKFNLSIYGNKNYMYDPKRPKRIQGVFYIEKNKKWIVRVGIKKGNHIMYNTISMHDTKEEAEIKFEKNKLI